jgi:hypothetical protein
MKSAKSVSDAITAPVLLLVEGEDEEYIVQAMCLHWFQDRAKQIDIENVGGRDNFPRRFKTLAVRTLGPLKVVGVIADSEENPQATRQRWSALFGEVEPKVKRPCRKLQLPNDATQGAFESLVMQALDNDAVANCARTFRDCVAEHIGVRTKAQKDKIAVQAWLSALLGSAYANVFRAQKDYPAQQLLNYDHEAFAPIKTFLEELLAEVDVVPEV